MTRHSHNFKDISGQRFGRLRALQYVGGGRWQVRCDCGVDFYADGKDLRLGRTRSCGCYRAERAAELGRTSKHERKGRAPRILTATGEDGYFHIHGTARILASILGVTPCTILVHVRTGKPVRGYTIRLQTPTP